MKKTILKALIPVALASSIFATGAFAQTSNNPQQPAQPGQQGNQQPGGKQGGKGGHDGNGQNGGHDGNGQNGGQNGGKNGGQQGPGRDGQNGGGPRGHMGGGGLIHDAALFLGLAPHEIMAMGEGKTLSELATSLGKDPIALEKALVAARDKDIDAQVTANRLTADQAKTMKANSAAVVKALLAKKIERPVRGGGTTTGK